MFIFLFYYMKPESWNAIWPHIYDKPWWLYSLFEPYKKEDSCSPGLAVPPAFTNSPELCLPGWATSRYASKVDSGLSLEERKTVDLILCMLWTYLSFSGAFHLKFSFRYFNKFKNRNYTQPVRLNFKTNISTIVLFKYLLWQNIVLVVINLIKFLLSLANGWVCCTMIKKCN